SRSSTKITAPSPKTNPVLSASNGRLTSAGSPSPGGKSAHRTEPGEHRRGDRGVGAAGDHHIGLTGKDEIAGLEQRVGTGGTGQGARIDGPVDTEVHRDLTGRHVRQ